MSFSLEGTGFIPTAGAAGAIAETTSLFMSKFENAVLDSINSNKELLTTRGLNVAAVKAFASTLCTNGYAEMKGTDQECRSICVTAQGAIEDALTKMLYSAELESVQAIFLTPLPTTPLRKKGMTEGLTNGVFDSARQYTLDLRENTVRNLREAGGVIVAAYSKESYEELKAQEDEGSLKQVETWESECKHERVIDTPLDIKIPDELVGALYLITDNDGNKFYLPTHGIQAKDAPMGEAIWRKWLTSTDAENEGVKRSTDMLKCVNRSE